MTRALHKLSARAVDAATKPGRYSDGGGLYLAVAEGRKRWLYLFTLDGKRREMGLGPAGKNGVSLAQARGEATKARELVQSGKDPIEERRNQDSEAAPLTPTFGEMADRVVADMSEGWRNEKHRAQWKMTLTKYAAPLRPRSIDAISTEHVLEVLKPLWQAKPETASRLRGRIERVLDAAKALGLRSGENPALWRGHLERLLPKRRKLTRGHHAAMPFEDVPEFMTRLRESPGVPARCLEFTILTAARSGEAFGARWAEINLITKTWTIPPDRMKSGRLHRVPLSGRVVDILSDMHTAFPPVDGDGYVFPGRKPGRPLSIMAMDMLLRRMCEKKVTVHGFRSSFRDWAGECTPFPREVAEAALAHVVGDETERAYRRGDALEKRRKLMDAWETFCGSKTGASVVPFALRLASEA